MTKNSLLLLVAVILTSILTAQQQTFETDYILSKCEGETPKEFTVDILEKTKKNLATDSTFDGFEKSKLVKFYENSNYFIQQFLSGGKVLFGDEMTNYVNKVAHNLLEKSGNEALKSKFKFYVLRSNIVNAICMPDGSIFITVGLLSQMENEAQLAFVIGHEMQHFLSQHGKESFLELEKLKAEYNRGRIDFESAVSSLSAHSREHEIESDNGGFDIFKKAGYATSEAEKMLMVLQYSHLPFDEKKIDATIFNSEHYVIPNSYFDFSDVFSSIEDDSERDDSKSSHPNIKTRITNVNKKEEKEGVFSYFDKKEFKYIQTKARFENQYLNILNRQFVKAVYESFLLKSKFPNNKYLDECIAKSLYAIAKQKEQKISNERNDSYKQGNSLVLFHLFYDKFTKKEMSILAVKQLLELNDKAFHVYIEDLVFDLYHNHSTVFSEFSFDSQELVKQAKKQTAEFQEIDSVEFLALTKIEKIKYLKKKKLFEEKVSDTLENSKTYAELAFYDYSEPEWIESVFDSVKKQNKIRYFDELSFSRQRELRKERDKKARTFKKQHLDSILILSVNYSWRDNKGKVNSSESFEFKNEASRVTRKLAGESPVAFKFLGVELFDSLSVDEMNDNFILNEWINEMSESYEDKMLSLTQNRADEVFDRTNYKKIMLVNFVAFKDETGYTPLVVRITLAGVLTMVPGMWPLLPIATKNYVNISDVKILDENGYIIFRRTHESNAKPNLKNNELFLNDVFEQIVK
ncbi:MAG: M48 family metallopeptidase [Flavobacteriales bacterium]|jgi:beta-barrel assembly-enhancing protease